MALTRVAAAGINTGGTFVLENVNTSGIVTAGTVQVGAATTIHSGGIDLGSGNITSHNINSTGIITATGGFVGAVTGNVTGNLTGNVTGNLTGDVTGDLTGNVTGDVTGDLTGNVTGNLTGNVTGNVSSSGANTLGSLAVTNDATVGGALTITGNLTVNGTTTTIDTAVTAVDSLAIDGDASVGGALTATGNITANAFYGDGSNLTGIDATQIQTGNTSVQTVDTGSDGHVKVTTEGTERLRVTSGGNIAVNDTGNAGYTSFSPCIALGDSGDSKPALVIRGSATSVGDISFCDNSGTESEDGVSEGLIRYDHNTDHMEFHTADSERLRIDSGGKVNNFINDSTTYSASSTPHNGIQVWNQNDTTNTFAALRLTAGNSGPATVQINSIREASGASALAIQVESSNTPAEALRIDSSGRMGLGTAGPGALLNTRWTGSRIGSTGVHFATSHGDSIDYDLLKVSNSEGGADASTKFLITGQGKMGVGTASPQNLFVVSNGGNDGVEINPIGENSDPAIYSYSRSGDGYRPLTFGTRDIRFNVGSSPSEKVRIDDAGRLLVGTNNARIIGADWFVQVEGTTRANSSLSLARNANSVESSVLAFGKSRSTSRGGSAIVSNGDYLGEIYFYGADGTDLSSEGARIECRVDDTPGSNSMPSRLIFSTTEDGEASSRERWRINHEGILTNQAGHHAHGSRDFINDYRCQFAVFASAESGTNGNSAVGTGPFDSTHLQSEWDNKTLTYGMAQELISEYNLSQTSRCNIGASFYALNTAGNDNSFPDGGGSSTYWTPYSVGVWARGANNGGYQGYAGVRADCQGYYGSSAAYYARVKSSPTSGRGHGFHCDLGGHVFGSNNVGVFVRQIDDQQQTGCTGFVYRRHNSNNTFNVLEVRNSSNSTIGSIRCSNSNTSFNTSSDYRLKENVTSVTNGIDLIKQMPVKTFNFIGDTETITGFIAHEIQDVAPYAVNGVKDGTKEVPATDENDEPILSDVEVDGVKQPVMETVPEYQSVDYGKLTPILTAALQEAIAKIETLEAQNAELAARLDAAGL